MQGNNQKRGQWEKDEQRAQWERLGKEIQGTITQRKGTTTGNGVEQTG
jgi:hypothetical protein